MAPILADQMDILQGQTDRLRVFLPLLKIDCVLEEVVNIVITVKECQRCRLFNRIMAVVHVVTLNQQRLLSPDAAYVLYQVSGFYV
jgi:hypothetical protein